MNKNYHKNTLQKLFDKDNDRIYKRSDSPLFKMTGIRNRGKRPRRRYFRQFRLTAVKVAGYQYAESAEYIRRQNYKVCGI